MHDSNPHDEYHEMRMYYMQDRVALYRPFMRPAAAEAMEAAIFGPHFAGSTDASALSLLAIFCAITQPLRVLELGTFYGFGTMTIAEVLATNGRPGIIVTVEPMLEHQRGAKELIARAGLESNVRFIHGFSTDEAVVAAVEQDGPYDIIYIDSSHAYKPTLAELDLYLLRRTMIRPGGLAFLHDITLTLPDDPGVGPAVDEWLKAHPEYRYLPLTTQGLWPQPVGFGIIQIPTE